MSSWDTLGRNLDPELPDFQLPVDVRRQHTYVLGRTGTGKSTMLARQALSDIERGDGLLVLDPHGDLVADIADFCPPKQFNRLILLDPNDREHPVPFNLFECKPRQNKDTVCSEVIGIFKKLYGDMWGPLLEDLLRSLTLVMLDHQLLDDESVPAEHRFNATLRDAHDFLFNQDIRKSYYPYIKNDMVLRFWTDFYDHVGFLRGKEVVTSQQIRHSSSTANKLRRFLLNPLTYDIFCNRLSPNPIDLRQIIDERKVLLVDLSKGALGEDNSELLGSVILSRLVVAALSRADVSPKDRATNTFHVIADEFQSFATESFKLLLSEARKYGVTLTIAHQHREQIDYEMRGAALNCGSIVCFRLTGRDAEDVGRDFDSSPRQVGWRYEPVMFTRLPEKDPLLREDPELKPLFDRYWELRAQQYEAMGSHREDGLYDAPPDPRKPGFHQPLMRFTVLNRPDDYTDPARVEEIEEDLRELYGEFSAYLDRASWHRNEWDARMVRHDPVKFIPDYNPDSSAPRPEAREVNPNDTMHRRVPTFDSHAERERAIANELTQLPNFHGLARLSDTSQIRFRTLPLPQPTKEREEKLGALRERTRSEISTPAGKRPSLTSKDYVALLRRQQAEEIVYESEQSEAPVG